MAILYNEEDLKVNSPGMTDAMMALLRISVRSSSCLKQKIAEYFGYSFPHTSDWCCSALGVKD